MAKSSGAMALNVLSSPMLFSNRQLIMDRVAALRLPAIYQWPEFGGGRRFCQLNVAGTVTPIALAVLRLITSSNLVGCSTGMSATLVPRKS